MSEWRVNLPAHHDGSITWEDYLANQDRLAKNRTKAAARILNGPAREGLERLQWLMLCGTCGCSLTKQCRGNGGLYPAYLCFGRRCDARATRDCDLLDIAVAAQALEALKAANIELALAVLHDLEPGDQAVFHR